MLFKISKYFFLISFVAFNSCKEKSKLKEEEIIKVTSIKNCYIFDSTLSKAENFQKGFVDTFTVNNSSYKVEMDTIKNVVNFFYNRNGKWIKNITDDFIRGYNIENDYNLDGFKDITNEYSKESNIYLWNPKENKFVDSSFILSWDFEVIDSSKVIYYSHYFILSQRANCILLKLKNYKSELLYSLDVEANDDFSNNKWILTKATNGNYDESNVIKKFNSKIGHQELDYNLFWKTYLKENKIVLMKREN